MQLVVKLNVSNASVKTTIVVLLFNLRNWINSCQWIYFSSRSLPLKISSISISYCLRRVKANRSSYSTTITVITFYYRCIIIDFIFKCLSKKFPVTLAPRVVLSMLSLFKIPFKLAYPTEALYTTLSTPPLNARL